VLVSELLAGRATAEGTERFARRFAALPGHFRAPDRLALSSIGLGTRPGSGDGSDDLLYRSAVPLALERGINVFDTALAFRAQRSERALGAALRRAIGEGRAQRDEVYVVSKAGYLVSRVRSSPTFGHLWGPLAVFRSLRISPRICVARGPCQRAPETPSV
jgi:hypothetical protein